VQNYQAMTTSEFFNKFKSKYLWGNLAAMAAVVVLLCLGTAYGLDLYTHHGEAVMIPNLKYKKFDDAKAILENAGLRIEVSDTGYVRTLPPDCILEQTPEAGLKVKPGHIVYVIINATESPTITLPDVIDNSSLREAMAKLSAMGFKLGTPQFVPGEKDWVYGILVNGRHVVYGDKISVDAVLTIQVGNGLRDASDSVDYIDPEPEFDEDLEEGGEEDPFQEVTTPPEPEPAETMPSTPETPTKSEPVPHNTPTTTKE
jgi:hypothetical protein